MVGSELKRHGSILHVPVVQADGCGVVVCGEILGLLVATEDHLNVTASLCIVADHAHLFMTTMHHLLMAVSGRIMHHLTKLESYRNVFLNITVSSLYSI